MPQNPFLTTMAIWDTTTVFLMILRMLHISTGVNSYFDIHIGQLIHLKQSLVEIQSSPEIRQKSRYAFEETKVLVESVLEGFNYYGRKKMSRKVGYFRVTVNIVRFLECIVQGTWADESSFQNVPHFTLDLI
jgi:hypothetical protein